jgi:N-acyl-D-aspartate/D-glutamate deacylase
MMKLSPILSFCLAIILIATPSTKLSAPEVPAAGDLTVITGATLIDGSGHAPVKDAVVVIKGDSILALGRRGQVKIPPGARVVDAKGLVVAPGFIDTHNHSDRGFTDDPSATTQVSQGITTVAIGQDGGSAFPIGDYLSKLDQNPIALNVLTFVGHATLRSEVMGEDTNRHATAAEIEKMKQMVQQAMKDGAFGLSTGLEYEVGKPATTEEVIALASVAGRCGGIYISHIRDEADKAFEAFAEAIRIGVKVICPYRFHTSNWALSLSGAARGKQPR